MTALEIKDKVMKGSKLAIERMLEKKRRDNLCVVVSDKGKVVKINARMLQ